MPNLKYNAVGFPTYLGSQLQGKHSVEIPWSELVRAAITVGRESWYKVIRHGLHSRLEIIYRSAMLGANFCTSPNREFAKTDAYIGLDPSEKSAISYFHGLSFTKFVAELLFEIHWLLHLDCIGNLPCKLRSNRRPDLIGVDVQGRWGVFEAKGRTNGIDRNSIQKAKEQTRMIRKINGRNPFIRVASISHFPDQSLELHMEYTDEVDTDAADIEISGGEDQFLRRYYRPVVSLIQSDRSVREATRARTTLIGNREIDVVQLPEVDLAVGLDSLVYRELTVESQDHPDAYNEKYLTFRVLEHLKKSSQLLSRNRITGRPTAGSASVVGPDGIYICLGSSWNS